MGMIGSLLYILVLLSCLQLTFCKNYLVATKEFVPTCIIGVDTLENPTAQLHTSLQWTKGQNLEHWQMSEWDTISDPNSDLLVSRGIIMMKGATIRHTKISYETTVLLPEILKKIINVHLPIKIQKELFIVNKQLKVYVKIENVPIITHLYITNMIDISNPKVIVSTHFIAHGPIPWFAKWAIKLLKDQILKSVDEFDVLFFKNLCL